MTITITHKSIERIINDSIHARLNGTLGELTHSPAVRVELVESHQTLDTPLGRIIKSTLIPTIEINSWSIPTVEVETTETFVYPFGDHTGVARELLHADYTRLEKFIDWVCDLVNNLNTVESVLLPIMEVTVPGINLARVVVDEKATIISAVFSNDTQSVTTDIIHF